MPRRNRKLSNTGIYHVLIRGINKQAIFIDEEDNSKMFNILLSVREVCKFKLYAYCFMWNHAHFLIKTENEGLDIIFKKIGTRYAYWYNLKYKRVGHLFQDRFKSIPVNNDRYFLAVLRYIHQNPLKAGYCKNIYEYRWSSYNDYLKKHDIIDFAFTYKMLDEKSFDSFNQQPEEDDILDLPEDNNFRVSETEAKQLIYEISRCSSADEFLKLDNLIKNEFLAEFKKSGLSVRQISRLTGSNRGIIHRAWKRIVHESTPCVEAHRA